MKKLKILSAGDIHGDSSAAKKLAILAEKEKVDLVILCGDITNFHLDTQNLIKPFKEKNLKLLLIPGNHDSFATADFLAELYGVKNIHGYSVQYKNVGIFGCGGANIGTEQLNEDEIYNTLKKGFTQIKDLKKRVMVTHVHPNKTKMENLSSFIPGSKGVKKAIDNFKPDILLCSHIHEAEGLEEKIGKTRVIHVGRQGKIIEI
ncbi:MAG TPA: metallophosphoesterase [Candidatus Nanoarchaeia archaeon]|nr:metallophosphoesterase [Candidatus Nanoarchaeia archaeon]